LPLKEINRAVEKMKNIIVTEMTFYQFLINSFILHLNLQNYLIL